MRHYLLVDTPEVRYAHREGRAIAYQIWGTGAVTCLNVGEWIVNADSVWEHPAHLRLWRYHASIAKTVRVDRSGIGSSDPPRGGVGDVDAWADDLVAVLDDVGCERAVVVGEGWGSHAAIALAANHRDRVDRLVLVNGYARMLRSDDYPSGVPEQRVADGVEFVRANWGTGRVVATFASALAHDYVEFCARYERGAASPSEAAAMVRASFGSDVRYLLPRIVSPTLIVYSGDLAHVRPDHSYYLVDHIEDASLLETRTGAAYDLGAEAGQHYVEFVTGGAEVSWADRQLAVVVFTDIVGSTAELSRVGDRAWKNTLDDANEGVVRQVARFGGRIVKHTGDGYLLTFTSPGSAISAILAIRRAALVLGLSQRFGLHMGEIEARADGDIAGIAVHTASRITDHATGDEILVSRVISDLLAGTGIDLSDRGSHELKGLPAPVHIYAVTT